MPKRPSPKGGKRPPLLRAVMEWYAAQCDGEWEQQYGLSIETLDNPGWMVTVHLTGTRLAEAAYRPWNANQSDADWLDCRVLDSDERYEGRVWQGAGDPSKLQDILGRFVDWVRDVEGPPEKLP